jgi:hypothetical protein
MALQSFPTGTPVSRVIQYKIANVARTDTVAKLLFTLPKFARILSIAMQFDTAPNAGTTAKVSVGVTSVNANEIILGQSVLIAGQIMPSVQTGQVYNVLLADTSIYGLYAETGAASTTGGPFNIEIGYDVTGPGKV